MTAGTNDPRRFLAPSAPWIVEALGQRTAEVVLEHHIDGRPDSGGSRFVPVFNPATGQQIAATRLADEATVDRAVAAALAALPAWSETAPTKRARVLFKLKQLLDERFDEIAALITREHGKVLADAKGELTRGIEVVEFACGIPQLLKGQHSDNVGGGIDNWSLRQPVGVCQHVRAEAERARSEPVAEARAVARRSRVTERRLQRRSGRQGSRRRAAASPRRRRRQLRRLD
jgi:hypothetical protein